MGPIGFGGSEEAKSARRVDSSEPRRGRAACGLGGSTRCHPGRFRRSIGGLEREKMDTFAAVQFFGSDRPSATAGRLCSSLRSSSGRTGPWCRPPSANLVRPRGGKGCEIFRVPKLSKLQLSSTLLLCKCRGPFLRIRGAAKGRRLGAGAWETQPWGTGGSFGGAVLENSYSLLCNALHSLLPFLGLFLAASAGSAGH